MRVYTVGEAEGSTRWVRVRERVHMVGEGEGSTRCVKVSVRTVPSCLSFIHLNAPEPEP